MKARIWKNSLVDGSVVVEEEIRDEGEDEDDEVNDIVGLSGHLSGKSVAFNSCTCGVGRGGGGGFSSTHHAHVVWFTGGSSSGPRSPSDADTTRLLRARHPIPLLLTAEEKNRLLTFDSQQSYPLSFQDSNLQCGYCGLPGQRTLPSKALLVTKGGVRAVDVHDIRCLSVGCGNVTMYSGHILGLLNIGSRILVSYLLLYDLRALFCQRAMPIRDAVSFLMGQLPSNCELEIEWAKLLAGRDDGGRSTGQRYVESRICSAYLAFEHMVERDWNDSLCGLCGYHPHAVVADGNAKMVVKLTNVELSVEGAPAGPSLVDSEEYYNDLESRALLYLRFPSRGIVNEKVIYLHKVAGFVPSKHLCQDLVPL